LDSGADPRGDGCYGASVVLKSKPPLESSVEAYLIAKVKSLGGKSSKLVSPGERGQPDRLVKLPGVYAFLVELKRPGKVPTMAQLGKAEEWRKAGMVVRWADSKETVDAVLAMQRTAAVVEWRAAT
jgi:hypothetical protein